MEFSIEKFSEAAKTDSISKAKDNHDDQVNMSTTKPPVPAWRLIPGSIPVDVQICACVACLTAFLLILQIIFAYTSPESPSRTGITRTAWMTAFWTYLSCCLHFADMSIDRQVRYELEQEKQSRPVRDKANETSKHAEEIKPSRLNEEYRIMLTAPQSHSTRSQSSGDMQIRPRKGWKTQEFKTAILFNMNLQGYSSKQLTRRATIVCALMIEGLVLTPLVLYLGRRLLMSEDDVEENESNISSWSLLFWSFAMLGISKYGSIVEKREQKEEHVVHEKVEQIQVSA